MFLFQGLHDFFDFHSNFENVYVSVCLSKLYRKFIQIKSECQRKPHIFGYFLTIFKVSLLLFFIISLQNNKLIISFATISKVIASYFEIFVLF
ncbi:hypothetical protein HMPREF9296_0191 [Prevotella disiens FB035-09AN]|uniref:Uncharacterized protein n=1 Tax=Prevotella disiens FB035-09AN TaxID=866771 RepID=E1KU29_9BACT|nr:hypothetical protein HMPREF9296_0191 [Prevotella disiens FB035-09AN]